MRLPTGTLLGPYEMLAPLGAGGLGEVYSVGRAVRVPRHLGPRAAYAEAVEAGSRSTA